MGEIRVLINDETHRFLKLRAINAGKSLKGLVSEILKEATNKPILSNLNNCGTGRS